MERVIEGRDAQLAALVEVRARTERELNPTDPPPPAAELAGELFADWTRERKHAWLATVDGAPAGEVYVRVEDGDDNRHRADVEWLAVVPELRRRGVADALVRAVVDWAEEQARPSLSFWVPTGLDGAGLAYVERLGAAVRMEERCSRLLVADLDRDVVDRWRDQGRARTDGYRLVQWVGPVPDQHLELMVAVHRAMEDMPTDDLDWTIPTLTGDDVRSLDASAQARCLLAVTTAAVGPVGEPAGFSVLFVNGHRPQLAWQGDTGVLQGHRGRGLGRWLKAENLEQALAVEPRIEVVETYNAESNPWMLEINVAMGFAAHMGYQAWQADAVGVRAAIGA